MWLIFLHRFHSLISRRILIQIEWFSIPWICLRVFFPNILRSLISHLKSSSDLIKFEEYLKDSTIFSWIRPIFIIILIKSWLKLKICEFGNCCGMHSWGFNDCMETYHQYQTPFSIFSWFIFVTSRRVHVRCMGSRRSVWLESIGRVSFDRESLY